MIASSILCDHMMYDILEYDDMYDDDMIKEIIPQMNGEPMNDITRND